MTHERSFCYNNLVPKHEPDDFISPIISKKRRLHCLPEGPIADLNHQSTKGMAAAKRLLGGEQPKVEGTMMKAPLQQAPMLPPGFKPRAKPEDPKKKRPELSVDPQAVVGMTHIDSYQTLMRNDRMEKPLVKGWQDEGS